MIFFVDLYSSSTTNNHRQQSIPSPRFTLHHTSQSDYSHSPYDEANRYLAGTSARRTSTSPNNTIYNNDANQKWTSNDTQHYYGLSNTYAPTSASNFDHVSFLQQSQLTNNTDQIQFWNDNQQIDSYFQCIGSFFIFLSILN